MAQIANINIAAVAITILVRLIIGPLCDRFGPRKTYTGLLLLGAIPVLGVAFAQSYESFLFFRLGIGAVGASFVITQYHTSVMFGPKRGRHRQRGGGRLGQQRRRRGAGH
jgi:NNP family nitrate/nitrite transporter-like MFS transporter